MSPFSPLRLPPPRLLPSSLWPSPHCCLWPWLVHVCSLATSFPFFHSVPPSLWQLSVCSKYTCHCFSLVNQFTLFIRFHRQVIWYLSFSDWLISLSIMFSRSIHAVAKVKVPSLSQSHSIPLWNCITAVFIHSPTHGLFPDLGYCK